MIYLEFMYTEIILVEHKIKIDFSLKNILLKL